MLTLDQQTAQRFILVLHSRVLDYEPGMGEHGTRHKRKFFDRGAWLAVRPMDELPQLNRGV